LLKAAKSTKQMTAIAQWMRQKIAVTCIGALRGQDFMSKRFCFRDTIQVQI